ncbi:hypothetical protein G7046_g2826 [Stylonectria norvegica]|nr:hypothetical protein G7046_g2826 [Stylonectria norvegica]
MAISQDTDNLLQESDLGIELDHAEGDRCLISRDSHTTRPRRPESILLQISAFLQSIHWVDLLRLLRLLKPIFLLNSKIDAQARPTNRHPTSLLDGMRGLAAFTVMIFHWSGWIYEHQLGWGAKGEHYDFLRLPVLRLFYHGSIQVDIFFVISGYVLSYRPIRFLRRGQVAELYIVLNSLLFRRWARLFLPIAASTLMLAILLQLGAYDMVRGFHEDAKYMTNRIEVYVAPQPTLTGELWHWIEQMDDH